MDDKELELVISCAEIFTKLGIKSVTMDELASQQGISKKTLYNYFTDKNDLVDKVLRFTCNAQNHGIATICEKNLNAIDESLEITDFIFKHINALHPSIMFDLQKYHAMAWENFKKLKREKIKECFTANITKGIKEGYYREDLNIPVIVHLYTGRFDLIFDEDELPSSEFDQGKSYLEMYRYHIRGIASDKGLKYLAKKIKKVKEQK